MEEFEKLLAESFQSDLLPGEGSRGESAPDESATSEASQKPESENGSSDHTTSGAEALSEHDVPESEQSDPIEAPATTEQE